MARCFSAGGLMDQEKITQTIRKMIADRNAGSAAEREKIYAAARSALDRTASGDPAAIMELETAIATVESSYAPSRAEPTPAERPRGLRRHLAAVATDVVLGALVAAIVVAAALPLLMRDGKAVDKLKYQYETTLPQVPVAIDMLNKVSAMVVQMQKADPAGLEAKAAKKYISLKAFAPDLDKQMPASLPIGSSIIVRADKDNYKILFSWTLCGAARIAKPEMVDPVRSKVDVLGCPYFGVWTPGAAKW
jgi:hypothetical protein